MRAALKDILALHGYEVAAEASNGQEAVDKCDALHPDLVFLDAAMPIMDGVAACRAIKTSHPDTKIILCATTGQKRAVVNAIQSCAQDFLVKPFQPARVLESLQKLLG